MDVKDDTAAVFGPNVRAVASSPARGGTVKELEIYQITFREQSEAAESLAVLDFFFSDEHL